MDNLNTLLSQFSADRENTQYQHHLAALCGKSSEDITATHSLLLYDRFINFPMELISPLHQNLYDDLQWIIDDKNNTKSSELTPEIINTYKAINTMILIRPCISSINTPATAASAKKANSSTSSSSSSSSTSSSAAATTTTTTTTTGKVYNVTGSTSIIFDNFEDEIFFQHADFAFQIPTHHSTGNGHPIFKFPQAVMMIISKEALSAIVQEIHRLVTG
jgi:hypothetical protein